MSVLVSSSPQGPVRSGRKPKGEGHSRRAEILAAAERIFVEHGYEGATIRKIADEVGLSSTALYMHFADKGEILQDICRQAFEELLAANRRITTDEPDPQARLRAMLQAYVAFGFAQPNAYRLIYLTRPIEARSGAQNAAETQGPELFRSFQVVLEEIKAAGRLRGDDAAGAARLFWAGTHGIVSLIITKPYFDWGDTRVLSDGMIDALIRGLLKA
ncbi:Nucleoid occlusion factor SlmA [Brevundimonas sp. NIBR10]|uniref:TetR/AcrR family transcriptional regulator n=1 Tax=Brevundimonas sp. NIBR10 TaxID=3015997 RepID=UPI0022F18E15|nr:TetR/AcrR family transcriptional regulator [Brevundimonas sp. NIBR10]WGM47562.1 Nucleoid occlusion factor SlmA [Brevundimonas sp. NIBR10]